VDLTYCFSLEQFTDNLPCPSPVSNSRSDSTVCILGNEINLDGAVLWESSGKIACTFVISGFGHCACKNGYYKQ